MRRERSLFIMREGCFFRATSQQSFSKFTVIEGVIHFRFKKAWCENKEGRFDSALSMRSLRAASSQRREDLRGSAEFEERRIFSHCHGQGWQRRGATAARGRFQSAPPCA